MKKIKSLWRNEKERIFLTRLFIIASGSAFDILFLQIF